MRFVTLLTVALLVGGCAKTDPRSRSFEVSGTVTFDGQPVADGGITLVSEDPTLASDAGSIKDGQFKFLASAGKKKVQIRASREIPQPGPKNVLRDPKFEEYIPAKYHENTELEIEVVPGGENRFDFPLKSK